MADKWYYSKPLSPKKKRQLLSFLEDDFCIYCQKRFISPDNLQRHIKQKHQGTYALQTLEVALEVRQEVDAAGKA